MTREAEAPQTGSRSSLEIHVQLQLGIQRSLEQRTELIFQKGRAHLSRLHLNTDQFSLRLLDFHLSKRWILEPKHENKSNLGPKIVFHRGDLIIQGQFEAVSNNVVAANLPGSGPCKAPVSFLRGLFLVSVQRRPTARIR